MSNSVIHKRVYYNNVHRSSLICCHRREAELRTGVIPVNTVTSSPQGDQSISSSRRPTMSLLDESG